MKNYNDYCLYQSSVFPLRLLLLLLRLSFLLLLSVQPCQSQEVIWKQQKQSDIIMGGIWDMVLARDDSRLVMISQAPANFHILLNPSNLTTNIQLLSTKSMDSMLITNSRVDGYGSFLTIQLCDLRFNQGNIALFNTTISTTTTENEEEEVVVKWKLAKRPIDNPNTSCQNIRPVFRGSGGKVTLDTLDNMGRWTSQFVIDDDENDIVNNTPFDNNNNNVQSLVASSETNLSTITGQAVTTFEQALVVGTREKDGVGMGGIHVIRFTHTPGRTHTDENDNNNNDILQPVGIASIESVNFTDGDVLLPPIAIDRSNKVAVIVHVWRLGLVRCDMMVQSNGYQLGELTEVWRYETANGLAVQLPIVVNDRVYLAWDSDISSIDFETGTLIWNRSYGGMALTSLVIKDEWLYVGHDTTDGGSILRKLSLETGEPEWEFPISNATLAPGLVVSRNMDVLYCGTIDGTLYSLNISKGMSTTTTIPTTTPSTTTSPPTLSPVSSLPMPSLIPTTTTFIPTQQVSIPNGFPFGTILPSISPQPTTSQSPSISISPTMIKNSFPFGTLLPSSSPKPTITTLPTTTTTKTFTPSSSTDGTTTTTTLPSTTAIPSSSGSTSSSSSLPQSSMGKPLGNNNNNGPPTRIPTIAPTISCGITITTIRITIAVVLITTAFF